MYIFFFLGMCLLFVVELGIARLRQFCALPCAIPFASSAAGNVARYHSRTAATNRKHFLKQRRIIVCWRNSEKPEIGRDEPKHLLAGESGNSLGIRAARCTSGLGRAVDGFEGWNMRRDEWLHELDVEKSRSPHTAVIARRQVHPISALSAASMHA